MDTGELQFRLTIDSRLENIELVQVILNDTLERMGLGDDTRHWVDLATREAVANAIKHGNHGVSGRRVDVAMEVCGEELVLRVSDQGEGFDPGQVGDPLSPENLLRPNGRGLFYMQSFMDGVEYRTREEGGTEVTMRKRVFARDDDQNQTTSAEPDGEARETDSGGEA